jgi:hypothetical protein
LRAETAGTVAKSECHRDSAAELNSTFERHHLAEDRQAGDEVIRRMERALPEQKV